MGYRGQELIFEAAGLFGLGAGCLLFRQKSGNLFLGPLTLSDVADQAVESSDAAVRGDIGHVSAIHIMKPDARIGYFYLKFDALARQGPLYIFLNGGIGLLPKHLGDQPAKNILGPEAEPRGIRLINEAVAQLRVAVDDEHRDIVGHQAELLLA